jgi:hypothetical protein
MALLKKNRTGQFPIVLQFSFTSTDTMVDTLGVAERFDANGKVFDVANVPINGEVVGGHLTVLVVSDAVTTHTASIGDADSATRYGSAINLKSAASTELIRTGYRHASGKPLRLTMAQTGGAATVGTFRLTAFVIGADRVNENAL